MCKKISYERLEQHVLEQLKKEGKGGSVKSLRAVFRDFRKVLKLSNRKPIGFEFSAAGIDKSLKDYKEIALEGLPESTINSKLSRIRFWHKEYVKIEEVFHGNTQVKREKKREFHTELKNLILENGLKQSDVIKSIGMPAITLSKWCRGACQPDEKSLSVINKLEMFFKVQPNYLSDLIWPQGIIVGKKGKDHSSDRLYKLTRDEYRFHKKDWPEKLVKEFDEYAAYKTALVLPRGKVRLPKHKWNINLAGRCPSQEMAEHSYSSYFGWLVNIKGYPVDDLTLLDLFNYEYMNEFLSDYMYVRLGGKVTLTMTSFLNRVITMIQKVGYYGQYPERLNGISRVEIYDEYSSLYLQLKLKLEKSRDTEVKIESLLSLTEPLKPIMNMLTSLRIKRDHTTRKVQQAQINKILVLISLLVEKPLRRESLRMLYLRDFVRLENGQYHITVRHFKNNAKHGNKPISFIASKVLSSDIDMYINKHRKNSPYVESEYFLIPVSKVSGFNVNNPQTAESITAMIFRSTSKYLDVDTQFGPHAFRHLVASHWLGKFPGEIGVVAELLNDNFSTVERNYSHKTAEKMQTKYIEHLDSLRD